MYAVMMLMRFEVKRLLTHCKFGKDDASETGFERIISGIAKSTQTDHNSFEAAQEPADPDGFLRFEFGDDLGNLIGLHGPQDFFNIFI